MIHRIRLPLLLYSYIASELLAPFFASFLILYCVFFLVRLIPLLEVVLELRIGLVDFIRLFSYIFPHMLLYVIPMASMAGVIIGFTRLTNDSEILALKACGISLKTMLPPVILIAAAIATLTGFFSVNLVPAGKIAMRQLMFQLAKEKIDKGLKENAFTEALGDLVVYVDDIDENEKWHGVYVSDMRGRKQPIITMAKAGYMKVQIEKMMVTIVLNDGTLHNTDGPDNQVIHFKRYQLQIPLSPPTRIDGEDITQLGRGSMYQQQLLETAQKHGRDARTSIVYLTEYHHRLALPVGCFILSLLGLPLGLQAGPGRRAAGIPLGLAFFVFYYITFTIGRVLSEDLAVPLVLGMWMPNVIFLGITIFVFWRADQEKSILPLKLQDFIAFISERYILPLKQRIIRQTTRLLSRRRLKSSTDSETIAATGLMIHANSENRVFHLPGCKYYTCKHCTIEFKDAQVAIEAGFEPCRFCRTLLEDHDQ
ncbi:MAG: LPS export ABC transporter permease LptF [Desulfobulbaceae bacterium]|nr:LPS export ABC transporter permease LptF [Desulfobulbaceae bacterium]